MLIILLMLYYFIESLLLLVKQKLEIRKEITFDQTVIELFLGTDLNNYRTQETTLYTL